MRRLLLTSRPAGRPRRATRPVAVLLAPLVLVLALAAPASAHGDLVDGSPGPGDDVGAGATTVRLEFTALDPDAVPLVAVLDEAGDPLAVGDATAADPRTVCAATAPLTAGVHTIEYSVVGEDGHRKTGRYQFQVSAEGAEVEPGSCAGLDLAPAEEARTIAELGGGGGLPGWLLWLLGALVALSASLVVLRVRSDRRRLDDPEQPDDPQHPEQPSGASPPGATGR